MANTAPTLCYILLPVTQASHREVISDSFFCLPRPWTYWLTQILILFITQIGSSFLILTASCLTWIFTNNYLVTNYCFASLYFHTCCSVAKSYLTFCDPMDCSMPGSSVLHYLLMFATDYLDSCSHSISNINLTYCCLVSNSLPTLPFGNQAHNSFCGINRLKHLPPASSPTAWQPHPRYYASKVQNHMLFKFHVLLHLHVFILIFLSSE